MPPLRDDAELGRYKGVLKEWKFTGVIQFRRRAAEWIRDNLANHTQKSVGRLMHEHREEVDQTPETREEYRDFYPYHYDFRIPIDGRLIYIETVFEPGATDADSTIWIFNMKPAKEGEM